ncbi:MAG: DNA adenine methylase [Planctomycetota bacterium]|nr:DNA adenine methylase [Planctomycetota bacterium]
MIKYLGSKLRLLPGITDVVARIPNARSAVDLFSGTARVAHALKGRGVRVEANDHNAYARTLAAGLVQADRERWTEEAERWIARLNALPPRAGWFTQAYAEEARFFRPENAARIEAAREEIAAAALDPELEAVLLTSLLLASDRVDSTTGVQMAYLKDWAPRSFRTFTLALPSLHSRPDAGACHAHGMDALQAAAVLSADVGYLDPPYNRHRYRNNYHVWETLVRWDQPETYGTVRKRDDCRGPASPFNRRGEIRGALSTVIDRLDCRALVVSFSDEGFLSRVELEEMLDPRGVVQVLTAAHPRYVGAKIGIHNPRGEKVGTIGRLENVEMLFVVTPEGINLDEVPGFATATASVSN